MISGVKKGMHGWIVSYCYTDGGLLISTKQKLLQSNKEHRRREQLLPDKSAKRMQKLNWITLAVAV